MKSFKDLPDIEKLNSVKLERDKIKPLKVNNHFHTPYSFSAFANIEEVLDMADKEDVAVLGINDFITTDGYEEFFNGARPRLATWRSTLRGHRSTGQYGQLLERSPSQSSIEAQSGSGRSSGLLAL